MTSTAQAISEYFQAVPEGEVVCAKQLLHLGSRAAVDEALYRMAGSGEILRISRGLYVRPVEGKYGRRPPNVERVIASVARLKGEEVQPSPAILANRFGLTTQVPMRESYQTSGSGRKLKLGKASVEMRRGPKWLFAVKSRPAREAASVVNWMAENGDKEKAPAFLSRLSPETRNGLADSRGALPAWMAAIVSMEMDCAR
ncbi:MAG: DUF6088 family protein [Parvibaculum sp.]